jgi:sterol desaturase/sphingolipid hydroxylase (fatty acid hydroxylase superfamily)
MEPRHYDKNFGSFTLLWGMIFATAHFPQNKWPLEPGEPKRLRDYLRRPYVAQQSLMRSR